MALSQQDLRAYYKLKAHLMGEEEAARAKEASKQSFQQQRGRKRHLSHRQLTKSASQPANDVVNNIASAPKTVPRQSAKSSDREAFRRSKCVISEGVTTLKAPLSRTSLSTQRRSLQLLKEMGVHLKRDRRAAIASAESTSLK